MKFTVEIFMNETDSILLDNVLFISFIDHVVKIDRLYDKPIFDMNEVYEIKIKRER